MYRGVVLLVCILVAQSFATDVEGFGSSVCGTQTFATTYSTATAVTFSVSSSNPKITVSPTTVTYSNVGTAVPVTITCNALGPTELFFQGVGTGNTGIHDSVWIYCTGILTIQNPIESIHRGETFEFILQLYPTPVKQVDVIIESLTPLIIPGSERTTFGIEQDVANAIFYVPAGGDVGPATLVFKSRTLRDYSGPGCEDLTITINVQGEIAHNVSTLVGNGLTYRFEVVISPPPLEPVEIVINTNFAGVATPTVLTFGVGQNTAVFDFTVTAAAGSTACIDFEGDFYEQTSACFTVIGSITTTIPDEINTYSIETYSVSLNPPAPAGGVTLTLTSSQNVQVTSSLFFAAEDSIETFQLVGVDTLVGPGWVELSAPGYETLRVNFNVFEVECASETTISHDGATCLDCPKSTNGEVCSSAGTCSYSLFSHLLARCTCDSDFYFGPLCEFVGEPSNYQGEIEIVYFSAPGTVVVTTLLPLTSTVTFSIPPGLLQDGFSGDGVAYIVPYDLSNGLSSDLVNPYENPPVVPGDVVTVLGTGFNLEIQAWDNTYVKSLNPPVLSRFVFHPLKVSQSEFLQLSLCFYDNDVDSWVPATSVCAPQYRFETRDLLSLTYGTNLCRSGQYQFFVLSPAPYHHVVVDPQPDNEVYIEEYFIADLYMTGTGLGGNQPPLPPQPVFKEEFADPGKLSPPKVNYLYESASSANVLFVSIGCLLVALLFSL